VRVAFEKQVLPNGLQVIVHEDRRVPLVAVSIWYHVGSKNEQPGQTGLAHLFEHLMFEGSEHQPQSYFAPLQAAGASINGSTSADRTDYWEVVPTEALRLALWMEADRMGWLLPAVTSHRFEAQRGVVLNERRQNYENRPYGLVPFSIARAVFPNGHPYSWLPIGEVEDLNAATVADAHAFFKRFYHPGNASLVIAGDVTAGDAFGMAADLFGEIPSGPAIAPVVASEVAARHERLVIEDRVDLVRLYLTWPSPPLFAAADADLDLAADLLSTGRTSRLYRRLVHDRRLATEVSAAQSSRELCGQFQIVATVAPGQNPDDVRTAISEELDRLRDGGPDDAELERGRARAEAAFVYRLQSLGGFGGKADQLNAYNVFLGQPDSFDEDLARYLAATQATVQTAARKFLDPRKAVELMVVPK